MGKILKEQDAFMETNAEQLLKIIENEGQDAILRFIEERTTESRFLDFKQKSDGDGSENLNKDDKKNYAKALSGFANSEGGILIWGVGEEETDDGPKVASVDKSISNVDNFIRSLNMLLPNAISRPIEGAFNFAIMKNGSDYGFAITYVPESMMAPHRAEFHLKRYYLRVGDNSVPMEHYQLEDMFGRRQRPSVSAKFGFKRGHSPKHGELKYGLIIELTNDGRGMASFIGVDFEFPMKALEGENSPPYRYKIDPYFDVEKEMALVRLRYNSREEGKAPLFPGETIKVIPDNYFLGHINYHVNDAIYSKWNGRELNVKIYADNSLPKESIIKFSDLNNF